MASNVLSFFFDSQADHQLNTLLIESLLDAVGENYTQADLQTDTVEREVTTRSGGRLDLVINTPTLLIGIENKLFHTLDNDLKTYQRYLHDHSEGRKVIEILLSLYPISKSPDLQNFIPITYTQFFLCIRKLLGSYAVEANQRYVSILFDFIMTIEHFLQENSMADEEFRVWVSDHHKDIMTLLKDIRKFKGNLRDQVKAMQAKIDIDKHKDKKIKLTSWLYEPIDLSVARYIVYDFVTQSNLKFALDIILSPTSWRITLVPRKPSTLDEVKTFFTSHKIDLGEEISPNRLQIGDEFEYEADRLMVASHIQGLIDRIVENSV